MGGKCFNNVSRIDKDDITPTIITLETKLNMFLRGSLLGSVGKKPSSGDIDIGIDSRKCKLPEMKNLLESVVGESNVRQIGKMLTIRYPIYKKDTLVQVDFLFGNPDWLKIFYFSSTTSEYTGSHRNGAIRALLRIVNATYTHDKGKLVKKEKLQWSPTQGLCQVIQALTKNKKTGDYTKTWKTTIVKTINYNFIPFEIFNSQSANFSNLDSFESIMSAVDKYYKNQAVAIYKEMAKEFDSMVFDKDFEYPVQIERHRNKKCKLKT